MLHTRLMHTVPSTNFYDPKQVYMATVPPGVPPGGEFNVMVNSHPVRVTCPPNVTPGMQIRIRLEEPQGALHQTFEVAVPQGVRPGQPFALIGGFRLVYGVIQRGLIAMKC